MRTNRYYELAWKVRDNIDEAGIKLDLNCPCDRAILSECGLTPSEVLEFLGLWDAGQSSDRLEDETRRTSIGSLR
jgi:hypothetical protein